MIKRAECLCDGKIIGIETIYTVIDGNQINIKEKLEWVREKGRRNELFCPCGCGANFVVVAGEKNLREQHFRIKPGSKPEKECTYVEEGMVSVNSKIILKCWLDEKIMPKDLESRVPICAVDDSSRKYEFTLLSRERGIAVNYCCNKSNLSSEKMEILDQNSQGIHIIHIIDNQNSGTTLQYPEGAMKVQERQGYCLFLSIEGFEYQKAKMIAAYYGKDIDGYWRENIFADGLLSDFWVEQSGKVIISGQTLNALKDECKKRFEEAQETEKVRRQKEQERREQERLRREAEYREEEKRRQKEKEEAERKFREEQAAQQARWEEDLQRREEERKKAEQWNDLFATHNRMKREKEEEEARKKQEDENRKKEEEAALWTKFKATLSEQLSQQEKQVRDSSGTRWIRCAYCGKEDVERAFSSYGGKGKINIGVCYDCSKTHTYTSRAEEPTVKPVVKYDPNVCPECGGTLRRRNGRNGPFMGCSNFPRCRFTRSLKE